MPEFAYSYVFNSRGEKLHCQKAEPIFSYKILQIIVYACPAFSASSPTFSLPLLIELFNMAAPPAVPSCPYRVWTSTTGSDSSHSSCQKICCCLPPPRPTARWVIRLAPGQRLAALRADTEGRKRGRPGGKPNHMVSQVHC